MDTPAPVENEKDELYLSWSSPSRLFKKRDAEFYKNIGAIVFLLCVIAIFAREFMLAVVALSIVFFIYVLSTVPPETVKHAVSKKGIESMGHFYRWDQLYEFWFEEQWGHTKLVIRPAAGALLVLILESVDRKKVQELLAKHIIYREQPQRSWVDNTAKWIAEKVPLDRAS